MQQEHVSTSATPFSRLFEPGRIGSMTTRNRIVMPAMGTNLADEGGCPTERTRHYYEARAKGGAGLVIVENACVDFPAGRQGIRRLALRERSLQAFREVADAVRRHGARVALQLHHAGRLAKSSVTGLQPIAPSAIAAPGGDLPRELTRAEIADLVDRFAEGALLAREAGFEGVEVHAAHGYLLAQFLSPASNRREDEYGGELRDRARFFLEVLAAVREAVGHDYPVWCRINGSEYGIPGGVSLDDAREVARMAQNTGADAVHVSAWGAGSHILAHLPEEPGFYLPLAGRIKESLDVPVIAVGRITPEAGEAGLREGKADFVAMGRALLADPALPAKLASGRQADVAPCIGCNVCSESIATRDVRCTVNAALGHEGDWEITPAEKARRVFVIGGGAAGLEAARLAALRGHEVVLYEKEDRLGGQMLLAALPPHKASVADLTRYLATRVEKLGVKVNLGTEATPQVVEQGRPDAVVVATGAMNLTPPVRGVDGGNVIGVREALTGAAPVGDRVAILGGGQVGCETAEFFAEKGRRVTIVEMREAVAEGMSGRTRQALLNRLAAAGVTMLTRARCDEVTERGLIVCNEAGDRVVVEADTVVIAAGAAPQRALFEALQDRVPEIHLAGDCVEPRTLVEAISEGARIGRAL